jgi:replicative DNA helicase
VSAAPHLRVVTGSSDGIEPPSDHGAESAVLSAVIVDAAALPKVIDFLRPEHFASEANRRVFEACAELFRQKNPIDTQTVASWLHARKRLVQVGGIEYITELIGASPTYGNVRAHAVAVHDAWRRRQVIYSCQKIAATGYAGVGDVQAWCDGAIRTLGGIGAQNPVRPVETNEQTLTRLLAESCATPVESGGDVSAMTGYPTGIFGLDRIIGGLRKGAKTTIAATTGVGKTALAMQLAIELAHRGVGVLFFSMELKREELLRRALAHEAKVSGERMKSRSLSPADKAALSVAARRVQALPWRIDETPHPTIEEIAAAAKAMAEQMMVVEHVPLGMIVVDYIQRAAPSRHLLQRDTHEQIAHATRSLKILCQELDCIGLELAQAKDGTPGRKPEKPKATSGIADSSKIAKESDDVIFLWPEDDPHDDPRQSVTAIVAKQRAGRKGEVPLMFRRDIYRFMDPNAAQQFSNPSRQYVDTNPLTEGL